MKLKTSYNLAWPGVMLVWLLFAPLLLWANDYGTLYKNANEAYKKGLYPQAISYYRQILDSGGQAEAVYFNLGNAYFKTGDVPSALLYYEKAHKLAPSDEDVNFNIYFANSKTTDKVEPAPEFFVTQWWHSVILFFPVRTLSVLSIVFCITGSGLLVLYLFTSVVAVKKLSFYAGILLLLSGLTFVFLAGRQKDYFNDHHQAIIFSGSVNVRSGPGDQAAILFILHDGTKVDILDNSNGWIKIELANGNQGWIRQSDTKEI
jgi:tetratricopeptide (TPR) repeat protein